MNTLQEPRIKNFLSRRLDHEFEIQMAPGTARRIQQPIVGLQLCGMSDCGARNRTADCIYAQLLVNA